MNPTSKGYIESLAEELAKLDCTNDESRKFRDVALRLIELHQHQSVSIAMAVLMMVERNKMLHQALDMIPPIIERIHKTDDYYDDTENSRLLHEASSSLVTLLRLIRNEI